MCGIRCVPDSISGQKYIAVACPDRKFPAVYGNGAEAFRATFDVVKIPDDRAEGATGPGMIVFRKENIERPTVKNRYHMNHAFQEIEDRNQCSEVAF